MSKKAQTFNVTDAVTYLKHTSLIIPAFLRDRKLPLKLEKQVEKAVKKVLDCCEICNTWDSRSRIVDGLCSDCSEDQGDYIDVED